MAQPVKQIVSKAGLKLFSLLPQTGLVRKLRRICEMKVLYFSDQALWNVERARAMGVKVGKNCRLYSLGFWSEPYLVEIGDDVIVSGEVKFTTHDGGIFLLKDKIPNVRGHFGKIIIGNNCFIGMGVIILPNVSIGNNCIIAAGSVVASSFPDNSIIMGNPAKTVFKFEMYDKMKCNNIRTVRNEQYPFPVRIPEEVKKEMLLKHFEKIPNPRPNTAPR